LLALVTACAAKPKAMPPPKPSPSSTVRVELPVPVCPAPVVTKVNTSTRRNAADWKAYALKLEQLLGIDHDGDTP
jgi:hypothetical protein